MKVVDASKECLSSEVGSRAHKRHLTSQDCCWIQDFSYLLHRRVWNSLSTWLMMSFVSVFLNVLFCGRMKRHCCFCYLLLYNKPPQNLVSWHSSDLLFLMIVSFGQCLASASAPCGIIWDHSFGCSQLLTELGWAGRSKKASLTCLTPRVPPCDRCIWLGLPHSMVVSRQPDFLCRGWLLRE